MELHRIHLHELAEFITGKLYRSLSVKPVTPLRVSSYLHNPRAHENDLVLYMLTEGEELLAFRTLWADTVSTLNGSVRFAWLSGNWVRSDLRQQGLAHRLLKEAMSDWNGRLMYTNYSPLSLQSYQRSGLFTQWYQHQGIRAYRAPRLGNLLAHRKIPAIVKPLLPLADILVRAAARLKSVLFRLQPMADYQFEMLERPDEALLQLADEEREESAFNTGPEQLIWKHRWPWISTSPDDYLPDYPFSSYAEEIQYITVKVSHRGVFAGFFIVSVRDQHLKTQYLYLSSSHYPAVARWMTEYILQSQIQMVTILHQGVSAALRSISHPFLWVKPFHMGVFATQMPLPEEGKRVQDGDGDYFFT